MKAFIAGGTGFVGSSLVRGLLADGFGVTILTRNLKSAGPLEKEVSLIEGDPSVEGKWQEMIAGHELIINLAGASIFKRWTKSYKKKIRESRILTTRNIVEGLTACPSRETLFISTSAVGYYGFHGDEELDEESPPGDDFLSTVSQNWERAALKGESPGVRVVLLRFGIVLGKKGGALNRMIPLFKAWLGSPLGSGMQWFSWIHEQDLVNIYLYLSKQRDLSGPINCTAPNPVRNRDLTRALGSALGKPTFLPAVPGFIIRLVMGEFGTTLIKGQKVTPKRLLETGFRFRFPDIEAALRDLVG
jgi:uncharacterized protein (TIGR01777 family)